MLSRIVPSPRLVILRLEPGDDVLRSLTAAAREHDVRTGLILGGAGSISRYRVHVVKTTHLPPGDVFFEAEGAYDVLALSGMILDGRVHAHITFSNAEKAMGGHVEEGCRVLTFLVATLAQTNAVSLTDWDRVGCLPGASGDPAMRAGV